MIAFLCKQCGLTLQRPERECGSLVFCTCGHGNRVPWESTTSAPAVPAAPEPPGAPPAEVLPPWRPRSPSLESVPRAILERDPAFCFNHQDAPSTQTCGSCGLRFCGDCVVRLQGDVLCGPCKNLRLTRLERPPKMSLLAVFALLVALATGPMGFCLSSMAMGMKSSSAVGFLGLVPQLVALVLGLLALREIEQDPGRRSGRPLAITALATVLVSCALTIFMARMAQGLGEP